METVPVFGTLTFGSTLTCLIAREKFITIMRRESFKSYTVFDDVCCINFRTSIIKRSPSAKPYAMKVYARME
jgi:hypothetical protein